MKRIFYKCHVCGVKTFTLFRRSATCSKCGTSESSVRVVPKQQHSWLRLPQRRTTSMADQFKLDRERHFNNLGAEDVLIYGSWEELLKQRPFDIPLYTAMEGTAVIAVLLSKRVISETAVLEELRHSQHPFGLHVRAFLEAKYPILRMNLFVPDNQEDPLCLESPLDICEGNMQDFIEALVCNERLELFMVHEGEPSIVPLTLYAPGITAVLQEEIPKIIRALPPAGSERDFLEAVRQMEQVLPQVTAGVDAKRTIQMVVTPKTDSERTMRVVDLRGDKEREIEKNAKDGKSIGEAADLMVIELIQIGNGCGYISSNGGVEYNKRGDHIRTREIGEQLDQIGGFDLMVAAHYKVRTALGDDQARRLESVWDGIGRWLS